MNQKSHKVIFMFKNLILLRLSMNDDFIKHFTYYMLQTTQVKPKNVSLFKHSKDYEWVIFREISSFIPPPPLKDYDLQLRSRSPLSVVTGMLMPTAFAPLSFVSVKKYIFGGGGGGGNPILLRKLKFLILITETFILCYSKVF